MFKFIFDIKLIFCIYMIPILTILFNRIIIYIFWYYLFVIYHYLILLNRMKCIQYFLLLSCKCFHISFEESNIKNITSRISIWKMRNIIINKSIWIKIFTRPICNCIYKSVWKCIRCDCTSLLSYSSGILCLLFWIDFNLFFLYQLI